MASGSLEISDWLRQFEQRVQGFVRDERPDTLIEFDLTADDRERLYKEVGKPFPWVVAADCEGAVTVAAVQAAADAEEGDEAFIRHFLARIRRPEERSSWDGEYGPATERFYERHFRHKKQYGPWRYVRTVFRHAGVVLAGIRAYAQMLDRLLVGGVDFTLDEYKTASRRVPSTILRPFLGTLAGFKFSRTTAQYLRRHRRGELSVAGLEALQGYRAEFWPELLAHLKREIGTKEAKTVPPPYLALDHERCCIVLRYPREWQARGIYRVGGHPVTYPDQRVAGRRPPRVQIGVKDPADVSPWWGAGITPIAVFRAGDGGFLGSASPGSEQGWTLRAGTCFVVAEQSLAPELESLAALPIGTLEVLPQDDGEPAYDIWQVQLPPATEYPNLGLRTVGREPLPSITLSNPMSRAHFAPGVFVGTRPAIALAHWTRDSQARYAIRLMSNGKEQELDIPAGAKEYALPVNPPCQGRVWVELRGFSSAADALSGVDFTALPAGVNVRSGDVLLTEEQEAQIVADLPDGWHLKPLTPGAVPMSDRAWRTPARTRTFDATIVTPDFTIPVSIRLPVISFEARNGANVIWLEELQEQAAPDCDLDGPPFAVCDIALRDHERSVLLVSGLRLGHSGPARVNLRAFLDAIDTARMPVGRIEPTFGRYSVQTDVWILSLRQLRCAVSVWDDGVALDEDLARQVPAIGSSIGDLFRLKREALSELMVTPLVKAIPRLQQPELSADLSTTIADSLCLAGAFDGSEHDGPAEVRPSCEATSVIGFRDGNCTVPPAALKGLVVKRWREALDRIRDARNEESDARELLTEWRSALIHGHPSRLAERPGGYHLTEAARRYCQAFHLSPGKLRNQALTTLLVPLDEACAIAQLGTTVRAVAEMLRQLARGGSGRDFEAERIAIIERPTVLLPAVNELRASVNMAPLAAPPGGLCLSDLLPVSYSQFA